MSSKQNKKGDFHCESVSCRWGGGSVQVLDEMRFLVSEKNYR